MGIREKGSEIQGHLGKKHNGALALDVVKRLKVYGDGEAERSRPLFGVDFYILGRYYVSYEKYHVRHERPLLEVRNVFLLRAHCEIECK